MANPVAEVDVEKRSTDADMRQNDVETPKKADSEAWEVIDIDDETYTAKHSINVC